MFFFYFFFAILLDPRVVHTHEYFCYVPYYDIARECSRYGVILRVHYEGDITEK